MSSQSPNAGVSRSQEKEITLPQIEECDGVKRRSNKIKNIDCGRSPSPDPREGQNSRTDGCDSYTRSHSHSRSRSHSRESDRGGSRYDNKRATSPLSRHSDSSEGRRRSHSREVDGAAVTDEVSPTRRRARDVSGSRSRSRGRENSVERFADGYGRTSGGTNATGSDGGERNYAERRQFWSRPCSPSRSNSRGKVSRDGRQVETLEISDEDASFILGSGGRTKRKLSRVCGAELNVTEQNKKTVLEIKGTKETRERAKLYVGYVMQQRVGPVNLDFTADERDDLTCIDVPHECVGYVTGRRGQGLRSIEEEWCTLMFFTDLRSQKDGETEKLAIFGSEKRARRGAELKVMSAVEQKMPGYFTKGVADETSSEENFATDTATIREEDYSYALGKEGSTRKKLARASGAILEYVGRIAYMAGTKQQRSRAREYLQWLCAQRTSYVHVVTDGRNDCTVVNVPTSCVAYVTGTKGNALRHIEDLTGTFIFLDGTRGESTERLLIFGEDFAGRQRAKHLVNERIEDKVSGRSKYIGRGGRGGGGGGMHYYGGGGEYRGRSRSRSRSYGSRRRYYRGGGRSRSRSRSPTRGYRSVSRSYSRGGYRRDDFESRNHDRYGNSRYSNYGAEYNSGGYSGGRRMGGRPSYNYGSGHVGGGGGGGSDSRMGSSNHDHYMSASGGAGGGVGMGPPRRGRSYSKGRSSRSVERKRRC